MDIKFRKLKFQDVFAMSRIIKKTGIKEEIKGLFQEKTEKSGKDNIEISQDQGLQLAVILFENIYRAEDEIYDFISDLSEIKREVIIEMSFEETIKLLSSFGKMEGIGNFFKSASKLMQ